MATERLAKDGVAHREPARDVGIRGLERLVLDRQEGAVYAWLRVAHGQGREPCRLRGGRAVPREREAVVGLGLDLLGQLLGWGVVVEHGVCAQGLEVVEVVGRGGGEDGETGEFGELDAQDPGCGAPSVDQDGLGCGQWACWEGKFEKLVQPLTNGRDADPESGGLLEADIVWNFELYITVRDSVVSEGTALSVITIAMMLEPFFLVKCTPSSFGYCLFWSYGAFLICNEPTK